MIMNEDNTVYNPPVIPEASALYYVCGHDIDYSCMYCNMCPIGDNYRAPNDETKELLNKQSKLIDEYVKEHNPVNGFLGIQIPFNTSIAE